MVARKGPVAGLNPPKQPSSPLAATELRFVGGYSTVQVGACCRSSEYWEERFRWSLDHPPEVPWESAAELTSAERRAIRESIQEFQIGEQSEGRHLRSGAREYSRRSGDLAYERSMALFIREEQGHAALLGRFMDLAGIERVRGTWVDSVFRSLRRFAGLETSICVLLTAEVIAVVYYASLREATGCPALHAICDRILDDESAHLEFQSERLAILRRDRPRWLVRAAVALQRLLFAVTVAVVWLGHKPVLRADNNFTAYWRRCQTEFQLCIERMDRR
jgi:hypothetical protein